MRSSAPVIGAVVVALAGCGRTVDREPDPWFPYGKVLVVRGHSSTAPRSIPPRGRFEFTITAGFERYDSETGLVTRHPAPDPEATTHVVLTGAERDTLWALLVGAGFFEAPPVVGRGMNGAPDAGPTRIEAIADSTSHRVDWDPTLPELVPQMAGRHPRAVDPEEPGLLEFSEKVRAMLERRPSYQALPRGLPTL